MRGPTLFLAPLLMAACATPVAAVPTKRTLAVKKPVPARGTIVTLRLSPSLVSLGGPRSEQQVLVTAVHADGRELDVTRSALFAAPKGTVSIESGLIRPRKDGAFPVTVRYAAPGVRPVTARLEVRAEGMAAPRPISFLNEVIPVLTAAGCNQGACHGAQYGKGGLRLSLLGFDPTSDRKSIVEEKKGKRVDLMAVEQSLLLKKVTMQVPHGGGARFKADSREYHLLRDWLAQGAAGPAAGERRVVQLEVEPALRVMNREQSQQLRATAVYSDGSREDVTARARFDTNNEPVATVESGGLVTSRQSGMAPLMIRYQGQAAVARIVVPYARPVKQPSPPGDTFIDRYIRTEWRRMGLSPSAPASDGEFIRRISLDLTGTLPSPEEAQAFVSDRSPGKRAKLVETLLARPEWVDYWTLYFGDILRNNRVLVGEKGMWSFRSWIQDSLRSGKPYNEMVRELIDVRGSIHRNGAANFYSVAKTPQDLAKTTSQVFLGIRLECAECHNHPFEKWTQNDYYSLSAYFAGVRYKGFSGSAFVGGDYLLVFGEGEVKHPRTGQVMLPKPLEGEAKAIPSPERLKSLGTWLADPKNPFVARNLVNRIWGRLMGRGIIDPVDDVRASNPPTHPELLDALTQDFVQSGFNLKHLMRRITSSTAYGLSSQATKRNERDTQFYAYYRTRRLTAEQLMDAVSVVTGVPERFPGLPAGFRAIGLPDPNVSAPVLDTFGRPAREAICECERNDEPNLSQTLVLMNGEFLQKRVTAKEGRLAGLLAAGRSDEEILRELYLRALSRPPTPDEILTAKGFIQEAGSREQGLQDMVWTLLNTREFLLQH